jgi:hypothetical protein
MFVACDEDVIFANVSTFYASKRSWFWGTIAGAAVAVGRGIFC